ncbi:MAG: flagellar biosynthesis protein FlhB [Deltaproteobacteria bacterium]|nr:flagellar biosynthesis protein FlhB [Deltaproteobacteria bacterium]
MPEDDGQEKTEQPSSRKREQARDEGSFATSKELSSFLMILGAMMILYYSGSWMFMGMADFMRKSFMVFRGEMTVQNVSDLFGQISYKFFILILPAFAIPLFGAVSYVLQNGFALTSKPLAPDFTKLDPISGAKKLFSIHSVVELVKSIVKVSVLSYVVYKAVDKEWQNLPFLIDMDTTGTLTYISKISFTIMTKTLWVLAVIAALDYIFQRWNFEKGLKMSKEELKEEMKEMEGDPIVKARIKAIQRELARKRMMADVPKADFVVTNPTHLAVAVKYDKSKSSAPIVLAKGAGVVAEKIREIAKKHGVPVIENKPLARALYKSVEIGKQIPAELYKAVAEMLAYVYKLKSKFRR